jgi:glutamate carboxypeptidase
LNQLLPFLQARESEMVAALRVLVEHESPSHDKAANDELAQVLAEQFRVLTGGTSQTVASAERGDSLRAEWNSDAPHDAPTILILTHFDTVWPRGTLTEMPFLIADGKAFGPGSFDMKAGIVQGLYALHALQSLRRKVGCKVVFLMTSDEEIGSGSSRDLIEAEAARSRCVLVLEPSASGALKTARKGTGNFQITVEGVSAHAGLEPEKGRSAIEELARQILALHALTDLERGTTLNVGVIEGGTASNVVAAQARAQLDLRVRTLADAEHILPLLLERTPFLEGTRVLVDGGLSRPPLERTAAGAALFETARRIAQDEMGFNLGEAAVGGASDGNYTSRLAPTLDGLGAVGDGAHARHEHVVIAEMPRRAALLARLIEKVSNQ